VVFVMEQDFKRNNLAMLLYNQCARLAQEWEKRFRHASLATELEHYINKLKKL
jgi:hypothetical protein